MSTATITVQASLRQRTGKGAARQTRAAGRIPAVVYGPGEPGRALAVEAKAVKSILSAPLGQNTVVTLDIDGKTELALLKSYDYHPLTRSLEHADFYKVTLDRHVLVQVPFHLEGKAKGVAAEGGVLRQIFRTLPVLATPDKIPASLNHDVTNVGLGESVHVRDLALPEGVTVKLDKSQTVVSIVAPERDAVVETATTDAAKAAAPAAKGAAPAAKAAAPAAKPAAKKK